MLQKTLITVLHLFRFFILLEVSFVAMETNGDCLHCAVQDVLHEQRRAKDGCVGLQPAAKAQTTQTQLRTVKFTSLNNLNIKCG